MRLPKQFCFGTGWPVVLSKNLVYQYFLHPLLQVLLLKYVHQFLMLCFGFSYGCDWFPDIRQSFCYFFPSASDKTYFYF